VRATTRALYDHIAMVIRTSAEPQEVYILEGCATGVQISRFSEKKKFIGSRSTHFKKMAIRRLTWVVKAN